jgi:hypothetical protein
MPWGFVVVGDDLRPEFVAMDSGPRIVICKIQTNGAELEPAVRGTLDFLLSKDRHKDMAVRAYIAPRPDGQVEARLLDSYASQFFDLSFSPLQGAGVIARKVRDRLPTEEAALEHVRTQHGDWARQMVEQLAPFFQLRTPRNRKEDILKTIKQIAPRGQDV